MNDLLLAYLGNAAFASMGQSADVQSDGLRRWMLDFVHDDDSVRASVRRQFLQADVDVALLTPLLEHADETVRSWARETIASRQNG
ncbi:MAG: hypothetical protein KDC95_11370 [Planctomycetes bacterium]|nr:hypothetical protein [Planctomycetota bacterium]